MSCHVNGHSVTLNAPVKCIVRFGKIQMDFFHVVFGSSAKHSQSGHK